MDVRTEALQAEHRIRPHIRETPVENSPSLSRMGDSRVFLKLENLQHTGSFKVRGAMNKLLCLTADERMKGIVAASSGNHGAAVAFALNKLGLTGIIFVPEDASPNKVELIRSLGADVRLHGADCVITEAHARRYAEQNNMIYVSPYNDPQVIAGQGTIGVELSRQMTSIDTVFVALGGGGMISGIAGFLKSVFVDVRMIGCSPANSPVMVESVRMNRIVEMATKPTLSDATAGGVEPGAITFDLCQRFVDNYVLVSEEEIRLAMRWFIEAHHMPIEGAAGVAVAAYLKMKETLRGRSVVIIICGANISVETLKRIETERSSGRQASEHNRKTAPTETTEAQIEGRRQEAEGCKGF